MKDPKIIIIVGATSGIGWHVARLFTQAGWRVGVVGRRRERLEELQRLNPNEVIPEVIDITSERAGEQLDDLIDKLGGLDIYLHVSGIGYQNPKIDYNTELDTVKTNVEGFTRMVTVAYRYFADLAYKGQIGVVSSIAGTKGLGTAAAYSATKRYQNTYIDALAQLARMRGVQVDFTDIRPGFVATDLLNDNQHYPMLMSPEKVAHRIFRALMRRERSVVIDWRYRLMVFFWRLIPRFVWERLPIKTRDKN